MPRRQPTSCRRWEHGNRSGSKLASAAAKDAYKQHVAAFHNLIRPHKMRGDIWDQPWRQRMPGQAPPPFPPCPIRSARSPKYGAPKATPKKSARNIFLLVDAISCTPTATDEILGGLKRAFAAGQYIRYTLASRLRRGL